MSFTKTYPLHIYTCISIQSRTCCSWIYD